MIYLPSRRRISTASLLVGAYILICALILLWAFHSKQRVQEEPLALFAAAGASFALFAALALRWPTATAAGFVAFTPINRFVIMLVYHFSHSLTLTKGVELWKEAVLGAILIRVAFDFLYTPERKHTVRFMDLLVLLFVLIGLAYLIYPGPLNTILYTRVQGLRSDTTFMLAYFAGRGLYLSRRRLKWIVMAIVPGSLVVGAVAVWQFIAPDMANSVFDQLGYADFVRFQGELGDSVAVRSRDIPGAESLPRASSLLLGDLALSFYQMFAVSLAAAMFYLSRRMRDLVSTGAFLALMIATLIMTLSRSAIASGVGAVFVMAFYQRAVGRIAVLTAIGVGVVAAVLVSGFVTLTTVEAMVNFGDSSSIQHQADLQLSIAAIEAYPFGRGLGTAGNIGQQQVGSQGITNESWNLQIGTEMGIGAMVLYVVLVVMATLMGAWQAIKVKDYWLRVVCLTVAGTGAAMLVLSNTLHAWENTPLSMVFWLFAGIAWRARELDQSDEYLESA